MLRLAVVLALVFGLAAHAQAEGQKILVVDRQRVLAESEPARRLRELEIERRSALRAALDQVQAELEAEEAEIAALRGQLGRVAFQERVNAFDQKVRQARAAAQQRGEEIQTEFAVARRHLSNALAPVLQQISEQQQADLIIDVASVLIARAGVDVTAQAIELMNKAEIEFALNPPAESAAEE